MYACEIWFTTQGNEEKLLVMQRIHGPTALNETEHIWTKKNNGFRKTLKTSKTKHWNVSFGQL